MGEGGSGNGGRGSRVHTSFAWELSWICWPVLGLRFPKRSLGPEVKAWGALQPPGARSLPGPLWAVLSHPSQPLSGSPRSPLTQLPSGDEKEWFRFLLLAVISSELLHKNPQQMSQLTRPPVAPLQAAPDRAPCMCSS